MMSFNSESPLSQNLTTDIQKSVSLAPYNTFRFDYQAEFFTIVESIDALKEALTWANQSKQTVTIIGGGSNLLISNDIPGLVILNRLSGIQARKQAANTISLTVSAGENWHNLVQYTVQQGWFGVENLALIPGTVGAAPVQNIGAYGVEAKDVIARVQVIDIFLGDIYWINAGDCGFAYRDSHFKGKWKDKLVITAVEFHLKIQGELTLSYGGLSNQLHGEVNLQNVFDTICATRQEKLPSPDDIANAGSFFKNPIVSQNEHSRLKIAFPNLVSFPFEESYKLAAGWLIDQAGWKGKKYQGVGVYDKQALVLVNYSEVSVTSLLALEEQIKHSVFDLYGVMLEREPVELPIASNKTHRTKEA